MDVDFCDSRVQFAKHFSAMQAAIQSSETNLCLNDSDGDDDVHACLPCPFCHVEIELSVLCAHLQEEHCFDVKNDWKKSQKTSLWTNTSAILDKELQELSSFLGIASSNCRGDTHNSAPDPLLSPFLFSLALSNAKFDKDESTGIDETVASTSLETRSTEPYTVDRFGEQDKEEMQLRAEFLQQLILSTIF